MTRWSGRISRAIWPIIFGGWALGQACPSHEVKRRL